MSKLSKRKAAAISRVLFFLVLAQVFASCEVEFSPNAEWKEIPVVYCVLDQDDDSSYVRVQRCFLGSGNQYRFAEVPDSIYYPSDALTVAIEQWNATVASDGTLHRTGDAPRQVFDFSYEEILNKQEGRFYNTIQPVYACRTAGLLDSLAVYRLVVVKNATGDTIATAETQLVYGEMQLLKPNNVTYFQFAGTAGSRTCELTWRAINAARQYQPIVRFRYRDFIVNTSVNPPDTTIIPHYIDIPCNTLKSNMRDPYMTTNLEQNYFLATIRNNIEDVTSNKNIIDTVDIYINCCNESLAAYIYAGNPSGSLIQDPFTYTNINGGIGVFASRRTHIMFKIHTPVSANSNYVKSLKELGVGF